MQLYAAAEITPLPEYLPPKRKLPPFTPCFKPVENFTALVTPYANLRYIVSIPSTVGTGEA